MNSLLVPSEEHLRRLTEIRARVAVSDVDEEGGRATLEQIEWIGEGAWIRCDVSRADQVQALVERCVADFGRLDGALNNAGISGETCLTSDCTLENWNRVLAVNLTGVWLCLKYEIGQLMQQGRGAIVNLASVGRARRLGRLPRLRGLEARGRRAHAHGGAAVRRARHPHQRGLPERGRNADAGGLRKPAAAT